MSVRSAFSVGLFCSASSIARSSVMRTGAEEVCADTGGVPAMAMERAKTAMTRLVPRPLRDNARAAPTVIGARPITIVLIGTSTKPMATQLLHPEIQSGNLGSGGRYFRRNSYSHPEKLSALHAFALEILRRSAQANSRVGGITPQAARERC